MLGRTLPPVQLKCTINNIIEWQIVLIPTHPQKFLFRDIKFRSSRFSGIFCKFGAAAWPCVGHIPWIFLISFLLDSWYSLRQISNQVYRQVSVEDDMSCLGTRLIFGHKRSRIPPIRDNRSPTWALGVLNRVFRICSAKGHIVVKNSCWIEVENCRLDICSCACAVRWNY